MTKNYSEKKYDVVVIGAGSAGLSACSEIRKKTDNFLVIDDGPLGTTCARVGCMPSKVFIEAANIFYQKEKFEKIGVSGKEHLSISTKKLMEHVRELRDFFVSSTLKDMDSWKDTNFLKGRAEFLDAETLLVNGQKIQANKIIVATGSAPNIPKNFLEYKEDLLTTDNFFELPELPKSIAVIGAGAIGLELAQAMARVGVKVFLFAERPSFGGLTDLEIKGEVRKHIEQELTFVQANVNSLEKIDQGFIVHGVDQKYPVQSVLLAMGRKPNLHGLKLDKAGVHVNEQAKVEFKPETCRIPNTNIYLVGDVNSHFPVLHEAADDGRIAGYNSVRKKDHSFKRRVRMNICFSHPPIAIIGKSSKELEAAQISFVSGQVNFARQGRARTKLDNKGLLKVYANAKNGKILGAELFAPQGEHLAHFIASAIESDSGVYDMLKLPFYHPVIEEGLRTALRDLAKKVEPPCPDFDLVPCQNPPAGS